MKRLILACLPVVAAVVLQQLSAWADDSPYRTVVDGIVPNIPGLSIQGGQGGCDLVIQNQTGQDVYLLDQSKPPKPIKFAAKPKSPTPPPPIPVPLAGAWPCTSLPAVTEDERWNHAEVTVGNWAVGGTVGAITFKLNARTVYDPALDPSADLIFYVRIGAGLLVVGGILISIPYLIRRRQEIFAAGKKAA